MLGICTVVPILTETLSHSLISILSQGLGLRFGGIRYLYLRHGPHVHRMQRSRPNHRTGLQRPIRCLHLCQTNPRLSRISNVGPCLLGSGPSCHAQHLVNLPLVAETSIGRSGTPYCQVRCDKEGAAEAGHAHGQVRVDLFDCAQ